MSKRLYILRHGNAENYSADGDAGRKLTSQGVREALSAAEKFLKRNENIELVVVSPYRRAQETAHHFLSAIQFSGVRENSNLITPSGKPAKVLDWLSRQDASSILLITHQPFASDFTELLSESPLGYNFSIATGTMVAIEGELLAAACCRVEWKQDVKI